MARMRSLKPEYYADEELATKTDRNTRLLYPGLWGLADEHGRLRGNPAWIKGQIFPYDDDLTPADVDGMIGQLEAIKNVVRYEADGAKYLYLPNLAKHQRLDTDKVPSKLPVPPVDPDESGNFPDRPGNVQTHVRASLQHVAGSKEHVAGGKNPAPSAAAAAVIEATGATPEEAAEVVGLVVAARKNVQNVAGLIRKIAADGDLGPFLDDARKALGRSELEAALNAARDGPMCPHDVPGGENLRPDTNEPVCGSCRGRARRAA